MLATSPQPSVVFFSAVPTPCGGRRRDEKSTRTPLVRLTKSQRLKRISDWLNRSQSVHSVSFSNEDDLDETIEDNPEQSLSILSIKPPEDDEVVVSTSNIIDPYETW